MQKTNLPIEALFPRLMRTAAYKTGNDQDAADLVSEAVLAALRAEAKGTVIENAEAYLMQVMENTTRVCAKNTARSSCPSTTRACICWHPTKKAPRKH